MTVDTSPHPFTVALWHDVQQVVGRLNARQALWLSGYLAGKIAADPATVADFQGLPPPTASVPTSASRSASTKLLIAYGSETGNSVALARQLAARAEGQGIPADVVDLAGVKVRQLGRRDHLLVVCSTHGDGDPPEPVHTFYETLMDENAPRLERLRYSVLALGDSSYDRFCETGLQLDERLAALGAQRLAPRQDCDVDYAQPADEWMERVLPLLPRAAAETASSGAAPVSSIASSTAQGPAPLSDPAPQDYSKQQPLAVEVLANVRLSAVGRPDPIHHLELALEPDSLPISPGDAVGVLADNNPALVAVILDATQLSGEQPVTHDGKAMPLVQALRTQCDLTIPSKRFLEVWATLTGHPELAQQATAEAKPQRAFLRSQQIRDLVTRYPGRPEAQALVDMLRPLQPRLYDVANSLAITEDELHLTVKHYRYPFNGREETGVASDYLVQVQPGDHLFIYPHRNLRFRLPEDATVPLILIGEGTGIAPYRAFIQELSSGERTNPCWMVFAEEHFEDDFLYQLEWQAAHREGQLERLDTVFYHDHPEQTLAGALGDASVQLLAWLRRGAHIYLCGDKDLLTRCEGDLQQLTDEFAAGEFSWKQLDKAKRIHRNLY